MGRKLYEIKIEINQQLLRWRQIIVRRVSRPPFYFIGNYCYPTPSNILSSAVYTVIQPPIRPPTWPPIYLYKYTAIYMTPPTVISYIYCYPIHPIPIYGGLPCTYIGGYRESDQKIIKKYAKFNRNLLKRFIYTIWSIFLHILIKWSKNFNPYVPKGSQILKGSQIIIR